MCFPKIVFCHFEVDTSSNVWFKISDMKFPNDWCIYSGIWNSVEAHYSCFWNTLTGDDTILISTTNSYFPTFICINIPAVLICWNCWINSINRTIILWIFCIKYKNFESEIHRNYKMLWIFQVSFEEFPKIPENFMEISYKIYKNLRSTEKIFRKFVRNFG